MISMRKLVDNVASVKIHIKQHLRRCVRVTRMVVLHFATTNNYLRQKEYNCIFMSLKFSF